MKNVFFLSLALLISSSAFAGGILPTGQWSKNARDIKVKKVFAGYWQTCVILENSSAKCFGYSNNGQNGVGSTLTLGDTLLEMKSLTEINLGTGRKVLDLALYYYHVCALLDNATVKCWGSNNQGQLGQGHTNNLGDNANEMGDNLPAVDLGSGRTALQVVVGQYHSCALLDNGTVKCWGGNAYGQLGQGNLTRLGDDASEMGDNLPIINLGTGRTARQLTSGYNHICALLDNSTIKCWGRGDLGDLGLGSSVHKGDNANEMGDNLPSVDLGTGRTALQVSGNCALLDNFSVKCWGYNNYGGAGQGHTNPIGDGAGEMGDNLPSVDLGTGRTARHIDSVSGTSCALLDNHSLKCWGENSWGKLGLEHSNIIGDNPGEMGDNLPTVNLGTGRTVTQVSVGYTHICAILDTSIVKCWGHGQFGQLGVGNATVSNGNAPGQMGDSLKAALLGAANSRLAKAITSAKRKYQKIAAGNYQICAIIENGKVRCWGSVFGQDRGDQPGEMGDALPHFDLGTGRKAIHISTRSTHFCALLDDSTVKCWGSNFYGQLGLGSNTEVGSVPAEMGDALPIVQLGTGRKAIDVTVGANHSCALLDNSQIKCWGEGTYGQLGQGNTSNIGDAANEMGDNLPVINLGANRTALQISAGGQHTCALLDNSTVKCWGRGSVGQLGRGNTQNIGDGASEMGDNLPIVDLGPGRTAIQVAAGGNHTCAILDDLSLKCWGANSFGMLGLGHINTMGDQANEMGTNLPAVDLGSGLKALEVKASSSTTCVILNNSTAKCWGNGASGQLGQGDTEMRGSAAGHMGDNLLPIDFGTNRFPTQIITESDYSCAVLDNSVLKCWGYNNYGQLGQGDKNRRGDGPNEMGDNLGIVNLGTAK